MDLKRIGRLALAGGLLLGLGLPAQARPLFDYLSLPDNLSFPMPFPIPGVGGGGGAPLTIPIPLPGGGSFPVGISMPGQNNGYYNQGGYFPPGGYSNGGGFMIPLPGGVTLPIPISFPSQNGGYYPPPSGYMPQPQNGGYYPPQSGYMPQPQNGGYFPRRRGGRRYQPQQPAYQSGDQPGYQQPLADGRVQGYETITYQGHPCAVNRDDLPVAVYSEDPSMTPILSQAAATWNEAGQRLGGLKFYEVVERPTGNAIGVDWSGRGMPSGAAGLTTMMKSSAGVRVTGIGLHPMRNAPERKLVEVLSHELGHALGLDHSQDGNDLMYRSTRPQSERRQMLSDRDFQMLQWLYSQQNAVPIVAAR